MGTRGPLARHQAALAVEAIDKPPEPPRHLGKAGRAAWRTVWRECGTWLTVGDDALIEDYARLCDEREALVVAIEKTGRTARGAAGQLTTHPLVDQLRQVQSHIARQQQVLGIGPQNRARLGVTIAKAAKEASHVDQMMARYRRLAQEGS